MGKNNKKKKSPKGRKSQLVPFFAVLGVIFVSLAVLMATKPNPDASTPVAPATGQLIENRPVLSPALFTGKVAQAYRAAMEIPKVLDSQYCYCHCKKERDHKNLLTCFTSKHGSKCETCINEAIFAHKLYKQGKTIDEIVIAIDKKFWRPYVPKKASRT
jgi:hypothetical protein